MPAGQYKATQMKAIDPMGQDQKSGTYTVQGDAVMAMKTKPPKKPMKGENPKNAQMMGPYGGKAPQGRPGGKK